jgi:hypothetical protein
LEPLDWAIIFTALLNFSEFIVRDALSERGAPTELVVDCLEHCQAKILKKSTMDKITFLFFIGLILMVNNYLN